MWTIPPRFFVAAVSVKLTVLPGLTLNRVPSAGVGRVQYTWAAPPSAGGTSSRTVSAAATSAAEARRLMPIGLLNRARAGG